MEAGGDALEGGAVRFTLIQGQIRAPVHFLHWVRRGVGTARMYQRMGMAKGGVKGGSWAQTKRGRTMGGHGDPYGKLSSYFTWPQRQPPPILAGWLSGEA